MFSVLPQILSHPLSGKTKSFETSPHIFLECPYMVTTATRAPRNGFHQVRKKWNPQILFCWCLSWNYCWWWTWWNCHLHPLSHSMYSFLFIFIWISFRAPNNLSAADCKDGSSPRHLVSNIACLTNFWIAVQIVENGGLAGCRYFKLPNNYLVFSGWWAHKKMSKFVCNFCFNVSSMATHLWNQTGYSRDNLSMCIYTVNATVGVKLRLQIKLKQISIECCSPYQKGVCFILLSWQLDYISTKYPVPGFHLFSIFWCINLCCHYCRLPSHT